MAISTLYNYYQSKGQTLPKWDSPERLALAKQAGITSGYTGSISQNEQIVNFLNQQTTSPTTATPATSALGIAQLQPAGGFGQGQQIQPAAPLLAAGPAVGGQIIQPPIQPVREPLLTPTGEPTFTKPIPAIPPTPAIAPQTPAMTADEVLKSLGLSKVPTAEELATKALSSSEFQLLQEKLGLKTTANQAEVDAAKAKLDTQYEADKSNLENKLAASGLAFSGIRGTQVKALIDSLASSKLDLDRKIASNLLDANLDLKEGMLKAAAQVIKEARDGRKEALTALKDIGLTVIGNRVIPTFAAQTRAIQQEQFERIQTRLEQQADEPAVGERLRSSKIAALAKAGPALTASKGTKGFVDPNVYMKLRNDYVQVIGDVSEYDDVFAPMLDPVDRIKLGVGKLQL